jgi:hypothetical protein
MSYLQSAAIGALVGAGGRAGYLAYKHGLSALSEARHQKSIGSYAAIGAAGGVAREFVGGYANAAGIVSAGGLATAVGGQGVFYGAATGLALGHLPASVRAAISPEMYKKIPAPVMRFADGALFVAHMPKKAILGAAHAVRVARVANARRFNMYKRRSALTGRNPKAPNANGLKQGVPVWLQGHRSKYGVNVFPHQRRY